MTSSTKTYINLLPTADGGGPAEDPREVHSSGCSGPTKMPPNPSTSCGPSSPSSALTFPLMVDVHQRPSPSPHPSPHSVWPPLLYHLPPAPAITSAAKLDRNECPFLECVKSTRCLPPLDDTRSRFWGWRNPRRCVDREPGRHRHLARHQEPRILIIVVDIRRTLPGSCPLCGWGQRWTTFTFIGTVERRQCGQGS